ncbi:MAG: alpha-glucosidase/alpha-galactosidase [Planctomycetota bacterium]
MPRAMLTKEKKSESSTIKVKDSSNAISLKIGYIGGGSRGWAHALMRDLAQCPHFKGEVRLYDINKPLARFNAKFANWLQTHPDAVSSWKYRAVDTLRECVKGADFIFLSIQPGPIQSMGVDLLEPMKYGIYQPVGDTVGPGGSIRALRTIRDYKVFGEAIGEYAPKAWSVNFTNPMTICTRALYEAFPGIHAWGCCHEVFGTQHFLGQVYAKMTGKPVPTREEVAVNVLGINHFTWIDKATCHGTDLIALLRDYIKKPGVIRTFNKRQVLKGENYFVSHKQVSLEFFRRFGVLAAAGDRHLAEFVPWFLTSEDSCYRWGFRLTPYSYRIGRYIQAPRDLAKVYRSRQLPKLGGSGEEYMNQMLAVCGKATFRTNVNLPNTGQMGKVPKGAVVETNAIFTGGGVEPVASGSLPDSVNQLVLTHITNQETLIKAVFTRDRDLAFQAFMNEPLCHRLGVDDAWKLFNTMIKKTNFRF